MRRFALLTTIALAGVGCLTPREVPELPARLPDDKEAELQMRLEEDIEASLPRVRYESHSPNFPELVWEMSVDGEKRVDREQIEGWIRQLESLDGDRPVVCRATPGAVFGDCTFPVTNAPDDTTPAH